MANSKWFFLPNGLKLLNKLGFLTLTNWDDIASLLTPMAQTSGSKNHQLLDGAKTSASKSKISSILLYRVYLSYLIGSMYGISIYMNGRFLW